MIKETDALLVWGGDVLYLCYWMRRSGLADLLPSLSESVYVGVSAGSMVVTPTLCPPGLEVSMYTDSGGCVGRVCPGVSRAQCSSPLMHGLGLFAARR